MAKSINQTGLRSLELYYIPVSNIEYGSVFAYKSQLRINDANLGVLLPEDYLPVAQRSAQAGLLAQWAIENVAQDIKKLKQRGVYFEWLSVYIPLRLLKQKDFVTQLKNAIDENEIDAKNICLQLPIELIYEDEMEYEAVLRRLALLEVKTMLCGFGEEFCPVSRMSKFKVDYVEMAPCVTANLISSSQSSNMLAQSLIELVCDQKSAPILSAVDSEDKSEHITGRCIYFTGAYAGKPKKIASIRS